MGSPYLQAGIGQKQVSRLQKITEGQGVAIFDYTTSILASTVKFVEYQTMDVESLNKPVQLLRILVAVCKKHPAYRAIRPATGNCEPCIKMWEAREALKKFENRYFL